MNAGGFISLEVGTVAVGAGWGLEAEIGNRIETRVPSKAPGGLSIGSSHGSALTDILAMPASDRFERQSVFVSAADLSLHLGMALLIAFDNRGGGSDRRWTSTL